MTLALTLALSLGPPAAGADSPTVEELLDATDDVVRGRSSHARIEMLVKTDRYERAMTMEAWSKGTEKTLIKILEPAKDAGIATLKVDDNIWNYLPKVDRTMKVPAGMMSGSWMGSHFSNDDLVKESRLSEDYTAEISATPESDPDHLWVVTLVPKPDAPVVWGKLVVRISADKIPVKQEYFDEKGTLVREMVFADVKPLADGRKVPHTMTLLPKDKVGEMTRITYQQLEIDVEVPDTLFSLQSLQR